MANQHLRDAITAAGIDTGQLADRLEVDAKTIERWLGGRVPYRRHRAKVAQIVGVTPHDLWPDDEPDPHAQPEPPAPTTETDGGQDDLVASYLGSEDPRRPDPHQLIGGARERIDVLGLTLTDLIASSNDAGRLADRAGDGCQVRVLLAAADSIHLTLYEAEYRPELRLTDPSALAAAIEPTLGYLQPLLDHPHVQARTHLAAPVNSILRADDTMLIALHLHGAGPAHQPVLHLQAHDQHGLFARFAAHYEHIWTHAAEPLDPDPDRYPHPDQHPDRYQPTPPRPRHGAFGTDPPAR